TESSGFVCSSRRRHTRSKRDWSSDVCSSDLGVQATLQCLSSDHVFVTGYTNAKTTSQFIKHKFAKDQRKSINIIASHPSGDDDFACAQYIKSILENANAISSKEVAKRIKHSHVAKKFFDKSNPNFIPEDMECCMIE